MSEATHTTACILCSLNCGIAVDVVDRKFTKIRGDRNHPISEGYQCQKASRLDFYQNGRQRLSSPLRRRDDGSFEPVSWDVAIREIAAGLVRLRDEHGGHSVAYYGGGGQGNHLGGVYSSALRAAIGTRYIYTSLAQEKTGGFWLDGKLFGRQTCHPSEDLHNADYVLLIGTNPWQSHGVPQARKWLNEIARDDAKTLVCVDPRVTETAKKADVHLQVRPGGDAHLLLAMLGTIVQEDLVDASFLQDRTTGYDDLKKIFADVDVDASARAAGLDPEAVRGVARDYARTEKACIRTDLGLEHSLHSTLNLYLSKLLYLLTGHFGKEGTNNLHSFLLPLIGHSKEPGEGGVTTKVTGMKEISKIFPPNVLPAEIDTDHPERIRGVFIDSSNPLVTAADTQAYRRAFEKLDLLVVIDVAMTETAKLAHWVLPASSQYEKWESTFFNLEFPRNFFHLRKPILEPLEGTLPEPEIYRRLCVAMGAFPERLSGLAAIAKLDRKFPKLRLFPAALAATLKLKPKLKPFVPMVLHETIGAALQSDAPAGDARAAGVIWGASQFYAQRHADAVRRAGIEDRGAGLGEALFESIFESPTAVVLSEHLYEDLDKFLRHKDGKIHLAIPEMIAQIADVGAPANDPEHPLILMAGERRSYNANTIIREGAWRKKDADGVLKMHPDDASSLGLGAGDAARCKTKRGAIDVIVEVTDEILPGVVSLPHGFGLEEPTDEAERALRGPAINHLTDAEHCDVIAKTPFHKYIPVRVEPSVDQAAGG